MNYCSTCAGRLRREVPPGDERARDVCTACGTVHYVNPKVVVGSVCTYQGRLLLCRRAIEPRRGYWTIPAGFMELGETAEAGAAREAWEEARARIAIEGLLAAYSVPRIEQVQLLFKARLLDDRVAAGPESEAVALVGWDAIPWADLAFPTVRLVLERAMQGGNTPPVPDLTPDSLLGNGGKA